MAEDRKSRESTLREMRRLRRRVAELEQRTAALERVRGDGLEESGGTGSSRLDNVYFRQLFERSPQAIVLLDPDDQVIDCNSGFERLFGYRREEARGRAINALIVPTALHESASRLSRRALAGEIVASEEERCRKDGSTVVARILGYPILHGDQQIGIFGVYSDVSARRRAEHQLRLQSAAMESAANAIFITDQEGRVEWVNMAFTRLSGYTEDEVLGRKPMLLDAGHRDEGLDALTWRTLEAGKVWRGQVVCRHRDGGVYTVEQTVTRIEAEERQVTHFVVVQEDISARIDAEQRLLHLSRHDRLTDLPNRYTLLERLEIELERAERLGCRVAVHVLDLDHFKDVNDTWGHALGDDLLLAVAERLKRTLRVGTTLSRTGGDEFAVIQTDFVEIENVDGLARRILAVFEEPFSLERHRIHIAASIGVAVHPPGEGDPRQLLKRADLALYRAKEEGRCNYRLHTEGMDHAAQLRMKTGQELYGALGRSELSVVYQPQIELPSSKVVAVEALARWNHPERGAVPPDEFIPIAEASGLIVTIGEWILRQACREALRWHVESPGLPVAVNVSAIQFKSPALAETVAGILEETSLPPSCLELEITEGVLMRPAPVVDENLRRLEELGVRFSLDDFGKGYSSLAYLRRLRLNKLKIDRSFVSGLESEPSQAVIVNAVAALGRQLGLEVVAEGVETAAQLEILVAKGCTIAQGHHFCSPVSAGEIGAFLRAGESRLRRGRSA